MCPNFSRADNDKTFCDPKLLLEGGSKTWF